MSEGDVNEESYRIFAALASPIRLKLLRSLSSSDLSYTELFKNVELKRDREMGKFTYHLKHLLKTGLIEVDRDTKRYSLTERGRQVLEFVTRTEEVISGRRRLTVIKSDLTSERFDKLRLVRTLMGEVGLPPKTATIIANDVLKKLKELRLMEVRTEVLRHLICETLLEHGLESKFLRMMRIGVDPGEVNSMIKQSLRSRDPIHMMRAVTEAVTKRYLLTHGFSEAMLKRIYGGLIDVYDVDCALFNVLGMGVKTSSAQEGDEALISYIYRRLSLVRDVLVLRSSDMSRGTLKLLRRCAPLDTRTSISINVDGVPHEWVKEFTELNLPRSLLEELSARKVLVNCPLGGAYPITISRDLDDAVLFDGGWVAKVNSRSGVSLVTCIFSINVFGLLAVSGWDFEGVRVTLREMIGEIERIIERRVHAMRLFDDVGFQPTQTFLIAPVGCYESAQYMEENFSERSENVVQRLLDSILWLRSSLTPRSRTENLVISSWTESLSSRLYDRYLGSHLSDRGTRGPHIDLLRREGRFLSSIVKYRREMNLSRLERVLKTVDGGVTLETTPESLESDLSLLERGHNVVLRVSPTTSS
ncbi:MAG: helix-turn-helix domain-containing protein [Aigarchaeota archaeon]|nr:helix-turn-helix domain-containing protein [Aigarchaeota archaeon]MDW8092670.1 helix-turn-helix domain-containing protein [Nitrososphaerota archaeon]